VQPSRKPGVVAVVVVEALAEPVAPQAVAPPG
jgi:hypothetical protein